MNAIPDPFRREALAASVPDAADARWGMALRDTIGSALATLRSEGLRAILPGLGILVGVAAVIATIAVAEGARRQVAEQIRSLGANNLVIWAGSITQGGVRLGAGQRQNLSWDDGRAIAREMPQIRSVAAAVRAQQQIVSDNRNWATNLTGVDPEFFDVQDWPPARGRLFTAEEAEEARKVVVLGATAAEALFGSEDPVGREVRIRATPFLVIGVLERKGQGTSGQDLDDGAFVPFWTARRSVMGASRANARGVGWIVARVEAGDDMVAAEAELRALMRQRHRTSPGDPDSVNIRNIAEAAAASDRSSRTLAALLAAIAGVSLVVGGIGVMNVMLVAVAERTREIGLRMALGARRRDIRTQFLIEAVVLATLGGAGGVIVGIAATLLLAGGFGWAAALMPEAMALAFGVSALVGLVFGLLPALRAARLDPIAALRRD